MTINHGSSQLASPSGEPSAARWLWALLLIVSSVVLSGKFSCATPFAALATLAALDMSRRDGLLLVIAVWLANQAVGFGLLGYPHDAQAYAWGLAIGLAAVLAYAGARLAIVSAAGLGFLTTVAIALTASFVVYEVVLVAGTLVLPSGGAAFSLPVIAEIGLANLIAFVVLLLIHRVLSASGWLNQISTDRLAA